MYVLIAIVENALIFMVTFDHNTYQVIGATLT